MATATAEAPTATATTFALKRQNDRVKQAIYQHPDNKASLRIGARAFAAGVPATLEVLEPEGGWSQEKPQYGRASQLPTEVKSALDTLAAFRKAQRDERIAKMSPEEKAEYDRKAQERKDRLAKGRETAKAKKTA